MSKHLDWACINFEGERMFILGGADEGTWRYEGDEPRVALVHRYPNSFNIIGMDEDEHVQFTTTRGAYWLAEQVGMRWVAHGKKPS